MNKKKQASLDRKNRIRTKKLQEAAKRRREREGLMMELNKLEAAEQAKLVDEMNEKEVQRANG